MQFFQEFNKMLKFIFIFLFLLVDTSYADINKIDISGNLRVSSSTIENLVNKKTTNVDSIYINNLTKKIYDTEFFSDVKISYNQEILKIIVVENPVVNFFYINGLEGDDLTEINKIITLKENVIFSNSKFKFVFCLFFLLSSKLFAQQNHYIIIDSIAIEGNIKTKQFVIERELLFKKDSIYESADLDEMAVNSKNLLFNTNLFCKFGIMCGRCHCAELCLAC